MTLYFFFRFEVFFFLFTSTKYDNITFFGDFSSESPNLRSSLPKIVKAAAAHLCFSFSLKKYHIYGQKDKKQVDSGPGKTIIPYTLIVTRHHETCMFPFLFSFLVNIQSLLLLLFMAHINFGKEGEEEGLLLSSIFLQQEQPGITFPELFPLFDGGSITTSSTVSTTTPTTAHYENTASDSDQNNNNNNNNKKKNRPSSSNKRSCDTCRKRKVKCDSNIQHPCTECKKNEIDCEFLALPRKRGRRSKEYVEVLESRLNVLERLLENKLVRRTTKGKSRT